MTAIKYGDSGNRWWVGLNVGSSQSTIIGTSSILSPSGYESLPSGNAADDAKFAAAAAKDKSGAPTTISVENVSWYNINGPYATQAAANAEIPAIQKSHPAPGAVSQLVDTATGQPQSANSAAGLTSLLSDLTDASLWVRIAKVAIGGTIVIVGLAKLTGADQKAGSIAAKAVKVAPLL